MLSFIIWTIILSLVLFLCLKVLGAQFTYLRKAYFLGITLWSSWLPVCCAAMLVMLLGINLTGAPGFNAELRNLNQFFGAPELLILFIVSPLLFTRANNIVGAAIAIYCLERLLLSEQPIPSSQSILIVMATSTSVAIIGDKMPWHLFSHPNITAHRMREVLILALAMAALATIFATIINFREFSNWLSQHFAWEYGPKLCLVGLGVLFIGWFSVALGVTRHFVLPAMCLPSIFASAYITQWPAYVLVVPFAAGLALSLAVTDRRIIRRG